MQIDERRVPRAPHRLLLPHSPQDDACDRSGRHPAERRHGLDVVGVREHVDGRYVRQLVAAVGEEAEVAGEGGGIAGDVDDASRARA